MIQPLTPEERRVSEETHRFTRMGPQWGGGSYCLRCGIEVLPGLVVARLPPCGEPLRRRP